MYVKDIMTTNQVHISTIKCGDTIVHDGLMRTVCDGNIKRGFCGITLFGDSYRMGTLMVTLVTNF